MPKAHRLSRADFARVARVRGRRVHGALFSLLVAPLKGADQPKIATVVSKKVSPLAVKRNAIERKAREAARPLVSALPPATAFVLYPKREALNATFDQMREEIAHLFSTAVSR